MFVFRNKLLILGHIDKLKPYVDKKTAFFIKSLYNRIYLNTIYFWKNSIEGTMHL